MPFIKYQPVMSAPIAGIYRACCTAASVLQFLSITMLVLAHNHTCPSIVLCQYDKYQAIQAPQLAFDIIPCGWIMPHTRTSRVFQAFRVVAYFCLVMVLHTLKLLAL